MKCKFIPGTFWIGCLLFFPMAARATAPTVINYDGILATAGGTPVTVTTSVVFSLYNAPIAGTVKWTETRSITPDNQGRFAVLLGQAVPLHDSVFKMPPLWLGTKVGTDVELTPRTLIASSPYSFRIATIDGATGGLINGDIQILGSGAPGSGLGVRDPGGNVGGHTPTSSFFVTGGGDTLAEFGSGGVFFVEATTGDTIFAYDPVQSTIDLGLNNNVLGARSTAIGTLNTVQGQNSFAIGTSNSVDSANAFGIGTGNTASGLNSFASGSNNEATGFATVVAGGRSNLSSGTRAAVLGGEGNSATGAHSVACGGDQSLSSGDYSFVAGGRYDSAFGFGAVVPGGIANVARGDYSFAAGRESKAESEGCFVWADNTALPFLSTGPNEFSVRSQGGVRFVSAVNGGTGAPTAGVQLAPGGGAWSSLSDSASKANMSRVNGTEILEKLSRVAVLTWNYKSQPSEIRHIGPMAQDFHAAFGVGEDDKHITTIDADGVALAAIQALIVKLNEQESENDELRSQIAELREMIQEHMKK